MKDLAILVGLGWFWLTFYGTGPMTSWTEIAVGAGALGVGCLVFAAWGARIGARRRPR